MLDNAALGQEPQASTDEPAPLLATKLYLPRPRPQQVARPRLLARLDAGHSGRLTLVAAPAGFGKTTLLAEWLNRPPDGSRPVAWLALDATDSDPSQFLRYVIAALQTIEPSIGAAVLPLLYSAQPQPLEKMAPLLANDLLRLPEGSLLVLDDYHVVETPAIHEALTFLIEHLPPQAHLVIASRSDPPLPLSRWRARGQLLELRAHDLRFTQDEAAAFLQEAMGAPLTAADVAALEGRTEGWIAGLQLAALSLRDRPDDQRASFIDAFTGSHRFVVDYLVDEVLSRQPPHLQRFLLQTSILHRLSGSLCDAVRGKEAEDQSDNPDAEQVADVAGRSVLLPPIPRAPSQTLLQDLEHSNLFIVSLDDTRRWYRYHHLFAQVLRERLASSASREAVALLHCRASIWFEGEGLVVEAVQHALEAQDWERAARLIEQQGQALLLQGQGDRVLGWIMALPQEVTSRHPFLFVLHAIALFFANQMEAAELQLQAAEEHFTGDISDEQSRAISGVARLIRGSIARFRGDLAGCIILARAALELLPSTDTSRRNAATLNLASAFLVSGDLTPASERLLVAEVAVQRAANEPTNLLCSLVTLAELQRRQSRLRQATATYCEAAGTMPAPGVLQMLNHAVNYYFGLGDIFRERNVLDAAEELLIHGQGMVRAMRLAEAESVTAGYTSLALLLQTRGDRRAAQEALVELQTLARQGNFATHLIRRAAAARARLALLQGDIASAVQWAEGSGLRSNDDLDYPREQEFLTLARVRIAQGWHDPAGPLLGDALRLLDRLVEAADAGARTDSVIEILVLKALAHHARSERSQALPPLEHALRLAAPEGYVRVFVDEGAPIATLLAEALREPGWGERFHEHVEDARAHAQRLMAVLQAERVEPLPIASHLESAQHLATPEGEPLTARELQVLQLLAAGRSNQAIADELIVAIGTVKRHVNSIMGKLQVESRLAAVARARDRGLV